MQLLSAAYGVMDALPAQLFNIPLSNVFAEANVLPKRMAVAYTTNPPTTVKTSRFSLHQQTLMGTSKGVDNSAHGGANSAGSDAITADCREKGEADDIVGAVY